MPDTIVMMDGIPIQQSRYLNFVGPDATYDSASRTIQVTLAGGAGSPMGADGALQMASSGEFAAATAASFTTSLTGPKIIGGSAADSTLTLQSTSGVGTSDSIKFLTGNGIECERITTDGYHLFGTTSAGSSRHRSVTSGVSPLYGWQFEHSIDTTGGAGSGFTVGHVDLVFRATDAVDTNVYQGFAIGTQVGPNAEATLGRFHSLGSSLTVDGEGAATNEYTPLFMSLRADIGTGYTQVAGPSGRYWLMDVGVHGPIGVEPDLLNGPTFFINRYDNNAPNTGDGTPTGGLWVVSRFGRGPGRDALHAAATTYPIDVGIGIVGTSGTTADGATYGFTTGLQVGGFGSGWMLSTNISRFGSAITVQDYALNGILLQNRTAAATGPAIAVDTTAGPVIINGTATAADTIKLQVKHTVDTDPLVTIGDSTVAAHVTVNLRNSTGSTKWFIADNTNQFLTGTITGDSGLAAQTANKSLHFGGTTSVIKVTNANTLAFFNVTAVAQQAHVADPTDLPTALTATASILDILENFGLVAVA